MNLFTITQPRIQTFSKSKSDDFVTAMRKTKNNTVLSIDLFKLKGYLTSGYSFYASNHSLAEAETVSGKTFKSTRLLVADIDHGNFTRDQLKSLVDNTPLKPALIYESQSSSEALRKYRMIFLLDQEITDKEEFVKLHKYVICKTTASHCDKEAVDTGCYDPGRIFYPANNKEPVEVYPDAITSVEALREELKTIDITKWHNEIKTINKPFQDEKRNRKKGTSKPKSEKADKSKKASNATLDAKKFTLEDVATNITTFLLEYKKESDLPSEVDTYKVKEFINTLPLSEMLGVEKYEFFHCFFHQDNSPSANVVDTRSGNEGLKCFGCDEVYSVFNVIHGVFNRLEGHSLFDTERMVLSLLDIQFGSTYQQEVFKQLDANIRWAGDLYDDVFLNKEKADSFARYLNRDNSLSILKEIYELAKRRCPLTSFTKEEDKCANLFFSLDYLQEYLIGKHYKGVKCPKRFGEKIRNLCELGLLERIDYKEIKDEKLKKIANLNTKTSDKVLNDYKERVKMDEVKARKLKRPEVKDIYYYRIPYINQAIIDEAVATIAFNKKVGKKKIGSNQKRLEGVNKAKSNKIYLQNEVKLSKKDKVFIDDATAFVNAALNSKGWFIRDEVIKAIDPNRNYYKNEKSRIKAFDDFMPAVINNLGIEILRVNKETRHRFNIPANIESRINLYIK